MESGKFERQFPAVSLLCVDEVSDYFSFWVLWEWEVQKLRLTLFVCDAGALFESVGPHFQTVIP